VAATVGLSLFNALRASPSFVGNTAAPGLWAHPLCI
jgi:hypothetical protein